MKVKRRGGFHRPGIVRMCEESLDDLHSNSKRSKWKTKIFGSFRSDTGIYTPPSSSYLKRNSIKLQKSNQRLKKNKISSEVISRMHMSVYAGASTHQFAIPDKVDEELNEETENEDGRNEHESTIKQNKIDFKKQLINIKPTDIYVDEKVAAVASGEAGDDNNKDNREGMMVQNHRDSIEDTK